MSSNSASYVRKVVTVNNESVRFQIWDTAGQETYRSLAPLYYRSASAVLIVFDVTRVKTFDEVKYWVDQVGVHGERNVRLIVIGNKIDKEGRVVWKETAL